MKQYWYVLLSAACVVAIGCDDGAAPSAPEMRFGALDSPPEPLLLTVENHAENALVGGIARVDALVTNNTQDYLFGVQVHWEITGPGRPRGWWWANFNAFCGASSPHSVDCTAYYMEPGQTIRNPIEIGALGAGAFTANASVQTGEGYSASGGTSFSVAVGSGSDVQVYLPQPPFVTAFNSTPLRVDFRNLMLATVVNNGPADATDIDVHFTTTTGAATYYGGLEFRLFADLDLFAREYHEDVVCTLASPDELVCRIPKLRAWQEALLEITLRPGTAGPLAISADVVSASPDPISSNNHAATTEDVLPRLDNDLSLAQTVLTARPSAGKPLDIELAVTNNGPDVTDAIFYWSGLGLDSYELVADSSGGSFCFDFGALFCYFYGMDVGQTARVHVTAIPDSGGDYVSYADVFSISDGVLDLDVSDNVSEVTIPVSGRIPSLGHREISFNAGLAIPCLNGSGYFYGSAMVREQRRLQTRAVDTNVYGFFHRNTALRATEGSGFVYGQDGSFHMFNLRSGRQHETDKLVVHPGKGNPTGEDLSTTEDFLWVEELPDGSDGMTLRWHITYRQEMDSLGRWFTVVERTDIQCK